jgi:hypothetical protein
MLPWHEYFKEAKLFRDPLGAMRQRAKVVGSGTYVYDYTCNGYLLGLRVDISQWHHLEADDPTQKAISRLIDEVKLGKAQAAVSMAEAHKTAAHVAHTAQRVAEALLALRRGRFGDFTTALGISVSKVKVRQFYTGLRKAGGKKNETFRYDKRMPLAKEQQESRYHDFLAKSWLEYSYGWKPLLKDVYDHAEALSSTLIATNFHVRTARGKAKADKQSDVMVPAQQFRHHYTPRSTKWVEFVVQYRLPEGAVNPMTAFGMTNPLLVAWELVPFSFVADWFLPVGQALEALTGYQDLRFMRGMKMVRHVFTNHGTVLPSVNSYNAGGTIYTCESVSCQATVDHVGIARTYLADFPAFGWPKFKDPRSVSHAASALALLQSLFVHGGTGNLKLR